MACQQVFAPVTEAMAVQDDGKSTAMALSGPTAIRQAVANTTAATLLITASPFDDSHPVSLAGAGELIVTSGRKLGPHLGVYESVRMLHRLKASATVVAIRAPLAGSSTSLWTVRTPIPVAVVSPAVTRPGAEREVRQRAPFWPLYFEVSGV